MSNCYNGYMVNNNNNNIYSFISGVFFTLNQDQCPTKLNVIDIFSDMIWTSNKLHSKQLWLNIQQNVTVHKKKFNLSLMYGKVVFVYLETFDKQMLHVLQFTVYQNMQIFLCLTVPDCERWEVSSWAALYPLVTWSLDRLSWVSDPALCTPKI